MHYLSVKSNKINTPDLSLWQNRLTELPESIGNLRQLEINNPPILRRIFVCLRSCCVGRIASYVTEATRPKTDKKASKVGGLFISSCLSQLNQLMLSDNQLLKLPLSLAKLTRLKTLSLTDNTIRYLKN